VYFLFDASQQAHLDEWAEVLKLGGAGRRPKKLRLFASSLRPLFQRNRRSGESGIPPGKKVKPNLRAPHPPLLAQAQRLAAANLRSWGRCFGLRFNKHNLAEGQLQNLFQHEASYCCLMKLAKSNSHHTLCASATNGAHSVHRDDERAFCPIPNVVRLLLAASQEFQRTKTRQ
jgi:hypothetical protein